MQYQLVSLLLVAQWMCQRCHCISYDPANYQEVYPDPRDPAVVRGRTPLHFAYISSLGGQFDASGSVAGVKLALDTINGDSSMLPGYSLHYTFGDSICDRTESLKVLFSQLLNEPTKLAIIGSGCSIATEPTAEVSHFYNISQISCASSSTALRNRIRFPSYFQMLTTEEVMAFSYYGAIKEYGWKRIAFIVQNENLFTVTIDRLEDLLDQDEVIHSIKIFESSKGIADLGDNPFEENARIFLFAMYEPNARFLLCEAYKMNIVAPRYTFLLIGWYDRMWWTVRDEGLSCTAEQIATMLPSSLAFLNTDFLDKVNDFNLTTNTGITGGEFLAMERQFIGQPPLNLSDASIQYSQYCHDAVWTLAFALNKTLNSIDDPVLNAELAQAYNSTTPFSLEDFTYNSNRLLDVIFGHIENTSFDGISGPVRFGDQGIRPADELTVLQFRNGANDNDVNLVHIGSVFPDNGSLFEYLPGEDINTVWNDLVPYDGVPLKEDVSIHMSVTVIFVLLACAGFVLAGVCLVFNFKYRKAKLVKLASSKLNYIIGAGAIILYLDSILFVIPSTNPNTVAVLCNITPWMTAIGYSLCYGTILTKMVRVYYIFNNPSTNKKVIQDWMLLVGVACLVAIDLMILIIYTAVEGARGNLGATQVPFRENPEDIQGVREVITEYCVYICDSTSRNIFLGVLYGYKMLLQIIALVLAFSIRKVKVKGLDDAKFIGASIYVTSIVLAVTIVVTYSLRDIVNAYSALISTGFLVGTSVILILVFVPLMVGLYKDPKGEYIFKNNNNSNSMSPTGTVGLNATSSLQSSEMESMRKRITELESELKQKETAIQPKPAAASATPKMRSESVTSALQDSNMVKDKALMKEITFSATIWDTPEERETEVVHVKGSENGVVI